MEGEEVEVEGSDDLLGPSGVRTTCRVEEATEDLMWELKDDAKTSLRDLRGEGDGGMMLIVKEAVPRDESSKGSYRSDRCWLMDRFVRGEGWGEEEPGWGGYKQAVSSLVPRSSDSQAHSQAH